MVGIQSSEPGPLLVHAPRQPAILRRSEKRLAPFQQVAEGLIGEMPEAGPASWLSAERAAAVGVPLRETLHRFGTPAHSSALPFGGDPGLDGQSRKKKPHSGAKQVLERQAGQQRQSGVTEQGMEETRPHDGASHCRTRRLGRRRSSGAPAYGPASGNGSMAVCSMIVTPNTVLPGRRS